jgi:hypothetical protein
LFITVPLIPCSTQVVPDASVVHPFQRVTVPDLADIKASDATKPAVAKAAVAIVLSGSKVACDPTSHLNTVLDSNPDLPLRSLTVKLSGAPCMTNGMTKRVATRFTPGGAIQANNLIAALKAGSPLLFEWKGSPYVLYGVAYDEYLRSVGSQDNVIRELLLIDPRYSDKRRFITSIVTR